MFLMEMCPQPHRGFATCAILHNIRKMVTSTQKCVLFLVTSLGCLNFTVQNDACADFYNKGQFSSAGGGKFLCAHFNSQFNTRTYLQDF